MDRSPSHQDLLTLARKVEAIASDGDRERLESAALHLFEALIEHTQAERPAMLRLPPSEARMLLRGQSRIVDQLIDLTIEVESPGPCRCEELAQLLLAELTLQTDDERRRFSKTQR